MPTLPLAHPAPVLRPALILALAFTLGAAGCGPSAATFSYTFEAVTTSPSPTTGAPTQSAAATPSASPAGQASPTPGAALPSKTTTEWGLIWDDLPSGFPRKLGSEPTETGAGPASAILIVPATTQETAAWYAAALSAAGYRVEGTSGPYEDGGYVIDATGTAPGCRVQVSLARQGTATIATIYFGAACPFR